MKWTFQQYSTTIVRNFIELNYIKNDHPELKNEFQQLDYKYNSQMKLSFNRDVCIFSIVDRVNQIS